MHIKKRIIALGLDTSHFNPYISNRNKGKNIKIPFTDILVYREDKTREKTERLRRAMLEYGFEPECSVETCRISKWLGKSITLQIDHIDGRNYNNIPSNLRFLCPNCHTQTETYGYHGKK